jgi:hypothetical protein
MRDNVRDLAVLVLATVMGVGVMLALTADAVALTP